MSNQLREAVDAVLDPGESIRVVVPGVDRGAIIGTDRRVLVARRGELVADVERRPQSWRHEEIREVRLETGRIAGTVTLEATESAVRAPVLMFDERDSDAVRAAVDGLREVLGHPPEAASDPALGADPALEPDPAPEADPALEPDPAPEAPIGGEPEVAGSAS